MATLLEDLSDLWASTVMNQMSNDITQVEWKGTDLTSDTAATATITVADPGLTGSAYNSIASAAVISWDISRRYRGGHPRTYVPGVPSGDIVNGDKLADLYATDLQVNGQAWLTGVAAEVLVPVGPFAAVNVSYYSGKARRITPVVDIITGCQVHGRLDTQRRRLGKEST
jgi:hypothetical protein